MIVPNFGTKGHDMSTLKARMALCTAILTILSSGGAAFADDFAISARDTAAVDDPREIDQEPGLYIEAPRYRYVDDQPATGDAGDVYNTTDIDNYEQNVAGNVYAPVLSTENVNKLYVDNSVTWLQNYFDTQMTFIKKDIRYITNVLDGVCQDMAVIEDSAADDFWQKNGVSYSFRSALGEDCGGIDWSFDKDIYELFFDLGYNQGCEDTEANLSVTYRYNGEDVGHWQWDFAHDNAHDRAISFKPAFYSDEDGDGRDDDLYENYVAGYNDGYESCGGTVTDPVDDDTTDDDPVDDGSGDDGADIPVATQTSCADATFVTSGNISAGGGNTFNGDVCLYGGTSVSFGGNDFYSAGTRAISKSLDTIDLWSPRSGSADLDDVKVAGSTAPSMVNKLGNTYSKLWAALSGVDTYSGDLVPDFVKNPATGAAQVVHKQYWWTAQASEIEPYTIYVVDGGMQFSGSVDAENAMFLANGQIGTGGGSGLIFKDVLFFGTQINLSGDVTWGDAATVCSEDRYSVYMLGTESISFGGWSGSTSVDGVVAISPTINPGGQMSASNVYFEASGDITIGGAFTIDPGCTDAPLDSLYTLNDLRSIAN